MINKKLILVSIISALFCAQATILADITGNTVCFAAEDQAQDISQLEKEISALKQKLRDIEKEERALSDIELADESRLIKKEKRMAPKAQFTGKKDGAAKKSGLCDDRKKMLLAIKHLEREKQILNTLLVYHAWNLRRPQAAGKDEKNYNKIIHLNLGFAYGMKSMVSEAINEYNKALVFDPYDTDIHFNLGYLLSANKRYHEAIEEYKRAFTSSDQDKEIYYNLAAVYAVIKEYDKSEECYRKFLELTVPKESNEKKIQPESPHQGI
jgi:tetratricopeptide (TPR) repeat protein